MAMRAIRIENEQNKKVVKEYLRQIMENNRYLLKNINKIECWLVTSKLRLP